MLRDDDRGPKSRWECGALSDLGWGGERARMYALCLQKMVLQSHVCSCLLVGLPRRIRKFGLLPALAHFEQRFRLWFGTSPATTGHLSSRTWPVPGQAPRLLSRPHEPLVGLGRSFRQGASKVKHPLGEKPKGKPIMQRCCWICPTISQRRTPDSLLPGSRASFWAIRPRCVHHIPSWAAKRSWLCCLETRSCLQNTRIDQKDWGQKLKQGGAASRYQCGRGSKLES